jgi:drug/metabolite transporter (DMT)-like permease
MRPAAPGDAVRGALCITGSATCFAGMAAMIRLIAETYALHPFEIAFFRNVFVLLIFLPWMLRAGATLLPARQRRVYLLRGVLEFVAVLSWALGVTLMPLAAYTAIGFTSVLFAVAIAALVLGEKVGKRRWTAVAVGFLGAVIVSRPSAEGIGLGAVLAIVSAVTVAGSRATARALGRSETADHVVFYMMLVVTPLTLLPALAVWSMPSVDALLWLVVLALVTCLGHLCLAQAYRLADVSALAPFDFFQLPAAALFGFLAFAQVPDALTWLGATIIVGSALYTTYREAVLRRVRVVR